MAPAINPAMGLEQLSLAHGRSAGTADFADHDDAFRFRIVIEHLEHVKMGMPLRIATDTDAGGLADAHAGGCQTASW